MTPTIILWHNEPLFDEAQERFCKFCFKIMLKSGNFGNNFESSGKICPFMVSGIKVFTLSMIETALQLTNHQISGKGIEQIFSHWERFIAKPVELLPTLERF